MISASLYTCKFPPLSNGPVSRWLQHELLALPARSFTDAAFSQVASYLTCSCPITQGSHGGLPPSSRHRRPIALDVLYLLRSLFHDPFCPLQHEFRWRTHSTSVLHLVQSVPRGPKATDLFRPQRGRSHRVDSVVGATPLGWGQERGWTWPASKHHHQRGGVTCRQSECWPRSPAVAKEITPPRPGCHGTTWQKSLTQRDTR